MLTVDDNFDTSFVLKNIDNFNGNDFYIPNFPFKPIKPISTATTEPNVVDADYEQFLADVWVGIVLTLMVLSCVCFMCTCLIYHKFQQWKSRVIQSRNADLEANVPQSDLPSYTIASGLPSYEEALEQLKKVKEPMDSKTNEWIPHTPPTPQMGTLSVVDLFAFINNTETVKNVS